MSFGKNLKIARIKKGLKQCQVSELTGIKQSIISNCEAKNSIPSVTTAVKLAKALGVTCEQLVSDEAEFLNSISNKSWNGLSENDDTKTEFKERIEAISKAVTGLKAYEWNRIKIAIDKEFSSKMSKAEIDNFEELKKVIELEF